MRLLINWLLNKSIILNMSSFNQKVYLQIQTVNQRHFCHSKINGIKSRNGMAKKQYTLIQQLSTIAFLNLDTIKKHRYKRQEVKNIKFYWLRQQEINLFYDVKSFFLILVYSLIKKYLIYYLYALFSLLFFCLIFLQGSPRPPFFPSSILLVDYHTGSISDCLIPSNILQKFSQDASPDSPINFQYLQIIIQILSTSGVFQNCGNFCYYLQNQKKKMNAKGKGKGKGKGLKIDGDVLKKFTNQHDGALDSSYFVQCQMQNGRWFKSRILDCRLAKDYDATRKKDQSSYQYYIHYEPLNRRNDQWVPYKRIRKIHEKIIEEDYKKKGVKKHQEKKEDNYSQHFGMDHTSLLAHLQATKFKTIHRIQLGKYKSETWYYSPYPIYYHNIDCLYLCEFCLSFFALEKQLKRHSESCPLFHPPGDEIYRDQQNKIAVFEVDGSKNSVYCENLGFLSKLFLDHKTLQWDMSIFLFYILCQIEDNEYHLTGYFSKPKDSNNNLSCILTLPFHQRKGYGKFLITFSYQLSLMQNKVGTPQKPLSDLGKQTYLSWWSQRLIEYIRIHKADSFTIQDIVKQTAMTEQDIQWTFQQMGIVKFVNGAPHLCTDEQVLTPIYKKYGKGKKVYREKIHWVPYKLKWDSSTTAL